MFGFLADERAPARYVLASEEQRDEKQRIGPHTLLYSTETILEGLAIGPI